MSIINLIENVKCSEGDIVPACQIPISWSYIACVIFLFLQFPVSPNLLSKVSSFFVFPISFVSSWLLNEWMLTIFKRVWYIFKADFSKKKEKGDHNEFF